MYSVYLHEAEVGEDEGGHGLDDRHRARHHARVVPPLRLRIKSPLSIAFIRTTRRGIPESVSTKQGPGKDELVPLGSCLPFACAHREFFIDNLLVAIHFEIILVDRPCAMAV